jgi:hypothetical protein
LGVSHLSERSFNAADGILGSLKLYGCLFTWTASFEGVKWSNWSSLTLARSESLGAIDLEALGKLFHTYSALRLLILFIIILIVTVFNEGGLNAMLLLIINNRITFAYIHNSKSLNLVFVVGALGIISKFK